MSKTKTDSQWKKWGDRNPYYGVLGWETSGLDIDETHKLFFETGQFHINKMLSTTEDLFGPISQTQKALDFGCGVGRLLPTLADNFKHVIGVDISPRMLELAQENTRQYETISFVRSLDEVKEPVDLVHSFIVLQHIRPKQGLEIMDNLLRLLSPGGRFIFHFTTGDSKPARATMNWFRYRFHPLHWVYNLLRKRPLSEPITEMNKYSVFSVLEMANSHGILGAYTQAMDQNGHQGIILYGRKPDQSE